jgi:hypothetical protein
MSKGCTHDLSYTLKADDERNLTAIVDQLSTVIVSGSLREMDSKVTDAIRKHFKVYAKDHDALMKGVIPLKFEDDGIGTLGNRELKVDCF